jgi:Xaa-Pro aminopeptidase
MQTSPRPDAPFQTFADSSSPSTVAHRLAVLRAELKRRGLDGFVVPRADEHQNEYCHPSAERLAWLTSFTGSAGMAIAMAERAALFVDGRYTVQAPEQTDTRKIEVRHLIDEPPEKWLEQTVKPGQRVGYDPMLLTRDQAKKLRAGVEAAGGVLVALEDNPLDAAWADRPAPPTAPVSLRADALAGEAAAAKVARLQAALGKADALAVSDPHTVAWLFNIRGGDVAHTPLPLSFALVPREGRPSLYIDGRKLSNAVRDALANALDVAEPTQFARNLATLGRAGKLVRFDQQTGPDKLAQIVESAGGRIEIGADPAALMRASKNAAELAGMRAAHLRDGAAMTRFLAWFDREAPKGKLTEIDAVRALEQFRRDTGALRDVSFPSIAGANAHAAIPHYRVTEATNARIEPGVFLIDSGAQYEDGTTDITRTIAVGEPTAEMKDRVTRVLQGMIAISRSLFPKGTTGAQIDAFARRPLWDAGLDFDHGTGHGVGCYLSVHEGPQRIAKTGVTPLAVGMILSNEPGYYKAGHWGVRIENLVVVEPRKIDGAEREMFGFETLTLAPIDLRFLDAALLTRFEVGWIDDYHARVRDEVGPLLDAQTQNWLEQATRRASFV